jgi:hypothetical protein
MHVRVHGRCAVAAAWVAQIRLWPKGGAIGPRGFGEGDLGTTEWPKPGPSRDRSRSVLLTPPPIQHDPTHKNPTPTKSTQMNDSEFERSRCEPRAGPLGREPCTQSAPGHAQHALGTATFFSRTRNSPCLACHVHGPPPRQWRDSESTMTAIIRTRRQPTRLKYDLSNSG